MSRGHGVAAVILAAGLGGCGLLPGDQAPEEGSGGVVVTARRESLQVVVPAQGYLDAVEAVPVAVPRVPTGALKVKELVDEGSRVEVGDVVVVFDESQLDIELQNQRAAFRSTNRRIERTDIQSEIELGNIEVMKEVADLERDNAEEFALLDESIFSRAEILDSQVTVDVAEGTIVFADASLLLRGEYYDIEERILGVESEQARGKIDRAETSLGSLVLRAPLPGLVVYRKNWRGGIVAVGDTLWPGNVILAIVDPSTTALNAFILERDAAGIEVGSPATVTLDAWPDRTFPGKVTFLSELSRPIESGTPVKYFEVKVSLDTSDSRVLKPGLKGEARIVAGEIPDAVVIPRSALRGDPSSPYVLLAGPGAPVRRRVTTAGGDLVKVAIAEGLQGGERLILGGAEPPGGKVQMARKTDVAGEGRPHAGGEAAAPGPAGTPQRRMKAGAAAPPAGGGAPGPGGDRPREGRRKAGGGPRPAGSSPATGGSGTS